MEPHIQHLYEMLSKVDGFIYPNELDLQWGILIVLYPYITGLVAGAFILASLERVFNVKVLKPTYKIALLTALAFLLVATLPLISHLGHPFRAYEILTTPNGTSAMAVFGFVYLWYLMVVLLLELWFDYRRNMVLWANQTKGFKRLLYRILALGITDLSPKALRWDEKLGYFITIVGVPSAILLHGYVGFIFGSVKANPWWSSVLMPVIFLFSAMVSGIALVMLVYLAVNYIRKTKVDMPCLKMIGRFLLIALILDFSLEALDQVHRIYEAEESFEIISLLMSGKLTNTLFIYQVLLGTLIPLIVLSFLQYSKKKTMLQQFLYLLTSIFVLIGVFFMRWNVVIGGQLFSKSFYGFTEFKLKLIGSEGILMAGIWMILPFLILVFLLWLFPPWSKPKEMIV